MKGMFFLMLLAVAVIFAGCASYPAVVSGVPLSKEFRNNANITHYPEPQKEGSPTARTPDFRRTVVQICFGGAVAEEVRTALLKYFGVRDFINDPDEKVDGVPVIQFSVDNPEWKAAEGGGRKGNLCTTSVHVKLVCQDGSGIFLGDAAVPVFADSSIEYKPGVEQWSWNSAFGVTAPGNKDPRLIAGESARRGFNELLKGKGWSSYAYAAVAEQFQQCFLAGK